MVRNRSCGERRHGRRRKFEGSRLIVVLAEVVVWLVEKSGCGPSEDTHKVIFLILDCLFCNVSAEVIRKKDLVRHIRSLDFRFIGGGYFVV